MLNLSGNSFEGSLPPELEALQNLRSFSASGNQLGGDLPPFLGGMSSLNKLALDGNKFGGTIPKELGMLTDLRRLYLERNELVRHSLDLAVVPQGINRLLGVLARVRNSSGHVFGVLLSR